ncbi:nucleotidyltransferase family protein [Flavobacterium agrisoli]|uniref:Nucleotidyltransferase family protein n=1 Tax=Flavobacterium agrisoli TaxID=2793066 RepID=A0A934UIC4_9FLAO|nr:nucleotidyltransferase family protein [Flavobacterium agrisoli]MBK0368672.1 nucleotidyltransferase family protein [Flavobacterium agrisoli]
MNQIATVVLAAGIAKRMGESKQLLPWGDSTLLETVIKNALTTDADISFVVLGAYKNEIEEKIDFSNSIVVINENWEQGLGSSIALITAEIDKKYPNINAMLFVLADQPFISILHLNEMMKLHHKQNESIILTKKQDYRGVPVLFPRKYFSELMLLPNDEGAKEIIYNNKSQVMEVVTQDNTADIDTYKMYEALRKIFKSEK